MEKIEGRIIKAISGFYYVHDGHDRILSCKARGIFRNKGVKPLPGDRVLVDEQDNIVDILPRTNNLLRPPVANVDIALLVFALKEPLPSFNLIDRLLAYYKKIDIPTVLCFNKTDLDDDNLVDKYQSVYSKAGIRLCFFSVISGFGLNEIEEIISEKTVVITGPSGVGKSSLINYLVPDANMETGSISTKLKRGKNTTRHSELFCIKDLTYIIDTPGFTSFVLDNIEPFELKLYYDEFNDYSSSCRFPDCVHIGETDCAVKTAVSDAQISSVRYNNYTDIYKELLANKKYKR